MKYTVDTWGYFKCQSEKEKGDIIALFDLLGLHLYGSSYDSNLSSWVLINGSQNRFLHAISGSHIGEQNFLASDFITANF